MSQFTVQPLGPYSLASSTIFLEGFAPLAYNGGGMEDHLHLGFVADGTEQVAGVCLHAQGDIIVGEVFGEAESCYRLRLRSGSSPNDSGG